MDELEHGQQSRAKAGALTANKFCTSNADGVI
jgi:hypothetical protein